MSIEILNRYTKAVLHTTEVGSLCEADLRRADLRWADLRGADLREADLRGADLRGADLSWADLRGADLREADLSGADLRWADLRRADLRWADLRWAEYATTQADFLRITGSRHPIAAVDEDNILIGCYRESLAWWREHYAAIGRKNEYTPQQIEEYRVHIEYAAQWLANQKVMAA